MTAQTWQRRPGMDPGAAGGDHHAAAPSLPAVDARLVLDLRGAGDTVRRVQLAGGGWGDPAGLRGMSIDVLVDRHTLQSPHAVELLRRSGAARLIVVGTDCEVIARWTAALRDGGPAW